MRQVAADDGEITRTELADMITDEGKARGLADEMDFDLRMEVPDVPFPGIVVETP
ncbi:hypothetical protein D3C71_2178770 [compost metagenome]